LTKVYSSLEKDLCNSHKSSPEGQVHSCEILPKQRSQK